MNTQVFRKFCPVCKMVNDADAVICRHCGATLGEDIPVPTTRRVDATKGISDDVQQEITRRLSPPVEGLAIFVMDQSQAVATRVDQEFVLGRAADLTAEDIVDLTDYNAFPMGVSRRHALIRSTGASYVIIDLNSSNGTWLNGQRLVPTKSYELPSGAVIQLGRMKLIIEYIQPTKPK